MTGVRKLNGSAGAPAVAVVLLPRSVPTPFRLTPYFSRTKHVIWSGIGVRK